MYKPEPEQIQAAEDALLAEVWYLQAKRRLDYLAGKTKFQAPVRGGKTKATVELSEAARELNAASANLYDVCHWNETEVLAARWEAIARRYAPGASEKP